MITTVTGSSIGDGQPGTSMGISYLAGMEVDAAGNVYILDQVNARVRKVDPITQIINTIAGNGETFTSGDGGPAINASLGSSPSAMCIDGAANIYVTGGGRIS